MPHLSKLPADTVLEVLRFLPFRDGLAFSMVSPFINHVASTRSYWHTLITANRLNEGPLSIPADNELTSYDDDDLKNIVLHKLRLEANWARGESQCVRLARPVKSFNCRLDRADNSLSTLLFHVAGTQLVLMMHGGTFIGWDVSSGQSVVDVPTSSNNVVALLAPPHYEPGRCTAVVGVTCARDKTHYAVILCLDYGSRVLTLSTFRPLPYDFTEHNGWAFNGDIVAHVIWDETIYIQAENFHDKRTSNIRTNIPLRASFAVIAVALIFWKGDLFIWHAQFDSLLQFYIHRCPANLLPSSNNPACPAVSDLECYDPSLSYMINDEDWTDLANVVQPPAAFMNLTEPEQLHFCHVSGRLTGLFYAAAGDIEGAIQVNGRMLMSWDFTKFTDSKALAYDAKPVSVACDTFPRFITQTGETPQAFSPSGSLLLARAPSSSPPELYVRLAKTDGSTTKFLHLEKPEDLQIRDAQIALDDGLGMVLVMHREAGTISVLQYV